MNWGKSIVVSFILFAAFIGTLVTVCMRQNVDLVSKDYYREELAYQDQILRMNNVNELAKKPEIEKSGLFLSIDFQQFHEIESGKLKLFSPSDPKKDKVYVLKASKEQQQLIPVGNVAKGMYRARMQWVMHGKEYFIETVVNI
jgi:hypothetical protein